MLVAVRQGQRRDAAATGEEQLGRCAARKGRYIRLYLYSGKLILAATYLRRVFFDGRSLVAGAPALTHVCTVGACGKKPRRVPTAALPGEICVAARLGQWATRAGQRAARREVQKHKPTPANDPRNGPLLVGILFPCRLLISVYKKG